MLIRGLVICIVFFVLGLLLSPFVPVFAEQRSAVSDVAINSVQRVPFESISVYPDSVKIDVSGLRYAKVSSNSMAPIITDKSVVFEKVPVSADEIKLGDVISFFEPSLNTVVLHSVIKIEQIEDKTYFSTQGLANPSPDPWTVPFERVKGIMVGTFR